MLRLRRKNNFALALLLSLSFEASASSPESSRALIDVADSSETDDGLHLDPNEFYPHLLNKDLDEAPEGLHVSVGGERSFLTGALNPRTKQLLILDRSQSVIRFARINILLLKLSKSREDYLNLRTKSNFEEWELRAKEKGLPIDEGDWKFWDSKIRVESKNGKQTAFDMLHKGNPNSHNFNEDFAFKHSNYMHIDSQYDHLKDLADKDNIQAIAADINDKSTIKKIGAAIKAAKLRLSSIDISNVWWQNFTSPETLGFFMKQLTLTASKKTKVIASDFATTGANILNHQAGEDVTYNVWNYNDYKRTAGEISLINLFRYGRNSRNYKRGVDTYQDPSPLKTPWTTKLCRLILRAFKSE